VKKGNTHRKKKNIRDPSGRTVQKDGRKRNERGGQNKGKGGKNLKGRNMVKGETRTNAQTEQQRTASACKENFTERRGRETRV